MLVVALCVAYVVFAQFPATKSLWRIALWSLGSILSVVVGAGLASWTARSKPVA